MARPHKVWKRSDTGWYSAKVAGKKTRRPFDKAESERMMFEVLAGTRRPVEGQGTRGFSTFRKLADLYLLNTGAPRRKPARPRRPRAAGHQAPMAGQPGVRHRPGDCELGRDPSAPPVVLRAVE